MNENSILRLTTGLCASVALISMLNGVAGARMQAGTQSAVGTAFTYQGRLNNSGGPVSGMCDLRFTLFDALAGGFQVGSPVSVNGLSISNGLFAAPLDFGSTVFDGGARWLEMAAACPAGQSPITMTPRQELTAAPYAHSLRPGAVVSGTGNMLTLVGDYKGAALIARNIQAASSGASGLYAESASAGGAAIEASNVVSTGVALQINKGKIRVVGAAAPLTTSNAPPVFQVQAAGGVPVSQIPMSHPLLNGQAQAIVFATPYQVDATIGPAGAGCASVSVAVMAFYSGTTWSLLNVAAGNIPASACYNVMIISP